MPCIIIKKGGSGNISLFLSELNANEDKMSKAFIALPHGTYSDKII
jgi:hypothetical protein